MAFTYALARATATTPAAGTQVAAVVCADGHGYVYNVPASGQAYPTTVRAIFSQPVPSNDSNASDALFTFQLNNSSAFSLPTDFTVNGNTDWIITATGTA
jgi:hypothetical protein